MPYTDRQIHYSIAGQGRPFIWSHGLMQSMVFDSQVGWFDWKSLARKSKLIRYDVTGHGLSRPATTPEECQWDRLGETMLSLADETNTDQFVAGGQSMGAATALYAALFSPERVKALVLVTPPTAWDSRVTQAANYKKMAERIEKRGTEGMAQLVSLNPGMPRWMHTAHPEKAELSVQIVRNFEVPALRNILLGAGLSNLPDTDRLSSLRMPTLILSWTEDAGHPVAVSERLAEILPHSKLVVANKVSDVNAWTDIIENFLAENDA